MIIVPTIPIVCAKLSMSENPIPSTVIRIRIVIYNSASTTKSWIFQIINFLIQVGHKRL